MRQASASGSNVGDVITGHRYDLNPDVLYVLEYVNPASG